MTAYDQSLAKFATMCNVPVKDADFFVKHVGTKMAEGMTMEQAIEHGREMMVQFLYNVQRYPDAARTFVASFHQDFRDRAAQAA